MCQVERLQEEVRKLHSIIREHEREIGRIFLETKQLEKPWTPVAVETQALSVLGITVTQPVGKVMNGSCRLLASRALYFT